MNPRPVLILGGSSDIGLAIAHRFAATGRPIILAGRQPEALKENAKDIALRHGVPAETALLDVLDLSSAQQLIDKLRVMPGVVVSAVGLLGKQEETEGAPEAISRVASTNFSGPLAALELFATRLAQLREDTAIIGISSVAGDRGRAVNYWYGAAKAAFTAGLSGLRQKHSGTRLLVMTVKPGFVHTAMTEGMQLPSRLTAQPDEVAAMVMSALKHRRPVACDWKWRLVMTAIRMLPERLFMRLKF